MCSLYATYNTSVFRIRIMAFSVHYFEFRVTQGARALVVMILTLLQG